MNAIDLPALRTTHPVAHLAALGLHRTVARRLGIAARLAWSETATPHAVLITELDRDTLVDRLAEEWHRQAAERAVCILRVDEKPAPFPPRQSLALPSERKGDQGMNDPAKMLPREYAAWAGAALDSGDPEAVAWLRAVATDAAIDRNRNPNIASQSGLYLLSRAQTLAQQFDAVWSWAEDNSAAQGVKDALTSWRRVEMNGGMNWDIDANENSAESPTGDSRTRLVPGAIWLAMMSLPYFAVAAVNGRARTRAVHEIKVRRRARARPFLVLPAWRPPLDVPGVEALLDHPALRLQQAGDTDRIAVTGKPEELATLGVIEIRSVPVVERRVANQIERYLGKSTALLTT